MIAREHEQSIMCSHVLLVVGTEDIFPYDLTEGSFSMATERLFFGDSRKSILMPHKNIAACELYIVQAIEKAEQA